MKIIAHRGNLNGPKPQFENDPGYLLEAMDAGFCVEVDLWLSEGKNQEEKLLHFGHDKPQYRVNSEFFEKREYDPLERIYFHCKNLQAMLFCHVVNVADTFGSGCKFFTHDKDPYTLVSDGSIWTYPDPDNELSSLSIPVVYDRHSTWNFDKLKSCEGICTDDALYFDALFNGTAI